MDRSKYNNRLQHYKKREQQAHSNFVRIIHKLKAQGFSGRALEYHDKVVIAWANFIKARRNREYFELLYSN